MFFAKTVWRMMEEIIKQNHLIRVQTIIDAEHKVSQKWAERMNFKREGVMRKYIGERDFIRYALVKY